MLKGPMEYLNQSPQTVDEYPKLATWNGEELLSENNSAKVQRNPESLLDVIICRYYIKEERSPVASLSIHLIKYNK